MSATGMPDIERVFSNCTACGPWRQYIVPIGRAGSGKGKTMFHTLGPDAAAHPAATPTTLTCQTLLARHLLRPVLPLDAHIEGCGDLARMLLLMFSQHAQHPAHARRHLARRPHVAAPDSKREAGQPPFGPVRAADGH